MLISKPERIERTFSVKNPTAESVRIVEIAKSCGCLDAELDVDELKPHGTAKLKVVVNAIPNTAAQAFNCVLRTDSETLKELVFRLEVESYPRMSVLEKSLEFTISIPTPESPDPETARFFQVDVYRDSSQSELASSEIEFKCPEPFEAAIAGDASQKYVSANIAIDSFRVRIQPASVKSPSEDGQGFVTVGITGQFSSAVSIPIRWIVRYPISITPKPLFFGICSSESEEKSRDLRLVSLDGTDFQVLSVKSESPNLHLEWKSGVSQSAHDISCVIRPDNTQKGAIRGTITVDVDHPDVAQLRLPWSVLIARRQ
jgi:hypothetical protein